MVRGVGIDATSISEFAELCDCSKELASKSIIVDRERAEEALASVFADYAFTDAERLQLLSCPRLFETMAGLFAVKEATFKAVAHLLDERTFDFRVVEVLHREDGWPYVNITPELREVLDKAGVCELHASITNEGDTAIAIVIAQ